MLDPRYALNVCIASTGTIWVLMILGALLGAAPNGLSYALLTFNILSTMFVYQRYRGLFW